MLSWLTKGRAYLGKRLANRSPKTPPVNIPIALPTLKNISMVAVLVSENPVICSQMQALPLQSTVHIRHQTNTSAML